MFTGIIEAIGLVEAISHTCIVISRPAAFTDIQEGSSIAISGICLTVKNLTPASMAFDLSKETLLRTTFGSLAVGSPVNLERALPATGRFEGHIVQGHVDSVGTVISAPITDPSHIVGGEKGVGGILTIEFPVEHGPLLVEKGSITIDGVSLTINYIDLKTFSVALIPFTELHTTLYGLQKGSKVNIEFDIIGKYIYRILSSALIKKKI